MYGTLSLLCSNFFFCDTVYGGTYGLIRPPPQPGAGWMHTCFISAELLVHVLSNHALKSVMTLTASSVLYTDTFPLRERELAESSIGSWH